MTKQEEQKIMLDILKSEFRCKNYICDKDVIFCSQCSNVTYSDEEIADALRYAIECIENFDILIGYVVNWANQDVICDDLYDYDEVGDDSWCSRNCKNFNRECVLKWLEWKRGVKNENV